MVAGNGDIIQLRQGQLPVFPKIGEYRTAVESGFICLYLQAGSDRLPVEIGNDDQPFILRIAFEDVPRDQHSTLT